MITVHHLNASRSHRILWLLEELGLPYEIRKYQRDPKTLLAPPELRAVHPLGKSPVVTDDGLTLAESAAIAEYLVETYGKGKLVPPKEKAGTEEQRRYRYFLHYAEGSLMPLMVMGLVFAQVPKAPMPFFAKPVARAIAEGVRARFLAPQLKANLDFVEAELGKSTYFAGEELTAADVIMSFPLQAAKARGASGGERPRIDAWIARIEARPAYRRAVERGGPLDVLR